MWANPSKFDSVHNITNRVKFRRICMESLEVNWANIRNNLPRNASFWQVGLLDVVLSEYPDKSHNFANLIYDIITLELYSFDTILIVHFRD